MKKITILFLITLFFSIPFLTKLPQVNAQTESIQIVVPKQNYYKGEVVKVVKNDVQQIENSKNFIQVLKVKLLEGPQNGKTVEIENSGSIKIAEQKILEVGDKVVVLQNTIGNKSTYSIWDKYRLNYVFVLIIGFFGLIIVFSGLKGLGSILGMGISFLIIIGFIVPQILAGYNPVIVTILGSTIILLTTIFLAHGISRKTASAVISTVIALSLTGILAFIFVEAFRLTGFGDENNYMLRISNLELNPQGLLLSGIIIGTLGVLDDVTTTQSAAIFELIKLDRKLSITDLFTKGYNIGRDHIASVVNSLILAYAGASLGLFVIFVLNPNSIPSWVMLNDEMITEEIVRAVTGSMGLILAVPITTLIASYIAKKYNQK